MKTLFILTLIMISAAPFAEANTGNLNCRISDGVNKDCHYRCNYYGMLPCELTRGNESCPRSPKAVSNHNVRNYWILVFEDGTSNMICTNPAAKRPRRDDVDRSEVRDRGNWFGGGTYRHYRSYWACGADIMNTLYGCYRQ